MDTDDADCHDLRRSENLDTDFTDTDQKFLTGLASLSPSGFTGLTGFSGF